MEERTLHRNPSLNVQPYCVTVSSWIIQTQSLTFKSHDLRARVQEYGILSTRGVESLVHKERTFRQSSPHYPVYIRGPQMLIL